MPGPTSIEGYAIVSADGMLADASRRMPAAMIIEADQQFFQGGLDRAAVIVHGRHSHEGGPRAALRRRLIVTTRVEALADDPTHPHALLWNPKGATLAEAWARLDAPEGMLAVIGGPGVYGMFLDSGYDRFHLSRTNRVLLPGGVPVFPGVGPGRTPEDLLAGRGLKPGPSQPLAEGAALVTWTR
jgi:dihydrofolate reductase